MPTPPAASVTTAPADSVTAVPPADRSNVVLPGGIAGWLYAPAGTPSGVCVLMGHGFACVRDQALPAYAEVFAAAGHAVLVFDYRGFGDSQGLPRQVVDIRAQQQDYRTALAWLRRQPGIAQVVLWGTSFSGGHVIEVAATDPQVAAVIAQVPFADGRVRAGKLPRRIFARILLAALADEACSRLGREPRLVPAIGNPGSRAALPAPDAVAAFARVTPAGSRWRNAFAPRVLLRVSRWRPGLLSSDLVMPLLVLVAREDATVPAAPAMAMAAAAPRGELVVHDVGHFEVYEGAALARAAHEQVQWLARVLNQG